MRIFVVDLLCIAPFYDRYLVEALSREVDEARLYAISYPYEPTYFDSTAVNKAPHVIDRVAHLGIRNRKLRRAPQLIEYAANWLQLLRDVRRERPSAVHIQWLPLLEAAPVELAGVAAIRAMGLPVVFTAHNALPHDIGEAATARYRRAYRHFNRIIVHTECERLRLTDQLGVPSDRVDVIPHGPLFHDLPMPDRVEARAQLEIGADVGPSLLCFGIVRPYKGIEHMLDAMPAILGAHPETKLLVVGQGDAAYLETLRERCLALGVDHAVHFKSRYIPVRELPLWHGAADIAIFPYVDASQSGALLTAAGYGVPVIATRVGGFPETIKDDALLVPPRDSRALAHAVAALLDEPPATRASIGQSLREAIAGPNMWDDIAKRTKSAYQAAARAG